MRQHAAVLVKIVFIWLCSCDKDDKTSTNSGCEPREATLEIGTGEQTFEPLQENSDLNFYLGPQGGYHVFGSLRTTGLDPGIPSDPFGPESPSITIEVVHQGALVGHLTEQPRLLTPGESSDTIVGQRVVLELADPTVLDGQSAIFSASAVDRCERTAEDVRTVRLSLAQAGS